MNMNMNGQQDWTPVVLRSKAAKDEQKRNQARATTIKNAQITFSANNTPAWKLEQKIDSDNGVLGPILVKVSTQDAHKIIQLRTTVKMSRADLAKALNLPRQLIDEIETCKALENKQQLNKIISFLNRKIVN